MTKKDRFLNHYLNHLGITPKRIHNTIDKLKKDGYDSNITIFVPFPDLSLNGYRIQPLFENSKPRVTAYKGIKQKQVDIE